MSQLSLYSVGMIRVAAVTPELRIGEVHYNIEKIKDEYIKACNAKAQVVAFPELCITSYSCADLFFQSLLLASVEKSLNNLCELTNGYDSTIIVGAPIRSNGQLYNCAVVIGHGKIHGVIPKTFLPNYNEFYEMRWFASANDSFEKEIYLCGNLVKFGTNLLFEQRTTQLASATSFTFGVEICEDLWTAKSPSTDMALAGAQVIFNLSASNEVLGKSEYRRDLVRMQSARCTAAYVYVSAGPHESTTDVVFAGHNIVCENRTVLCESERYTFGSSMILADIDIERLNNERIHNSTYRVESPNKEFERVPLFLADVEVESLLRSVSANPFVPAQSESRSSRCREIFALQSTALSKRLLHIGCNNVVIGVSGGLDSTLALLVCIESFKKLNLDVGGIHAVTMPGFGTTTRTKSNAEQLAESLGVTLKNIPINEAVIQHFNDIQHPATLYNTVYENAQARERTQILMDIANQVNGIVIGTGDLSELALGWSTYNGDHMSMYSVNCGVPKTLVKYIVQWCSDELFKGSASSILHDICNSPISPELLPEITDGVNAQETEKSIGPYELHDFFLYYHIRFGFSPFKIFTLAALAFHNIYEHSVIKRWLKVFYSRFFSQQFKRSAMPDGPKVGGVSLSPRGDWRMPSDASAELWLGQVDEL